MSLTSNGVRVESDWFDIPYGVLLPKGIEGVLVASGKAISATRDAHARILRGQNSCMILGQAAGTAAACAVKNDTSPATLDVKVLQQTLTKANVRLG
jgi:hypothetical protein